MAEKCQIPPVPAGLAARGRALWRQVHQSFELDGIEAELLEELCRTLDFCDRIRRELKGKPLTVQGSTGQMRTNPLVATLEAQTKLADRLAGSLGVSMPGVASSGAKPRGHQRKAVNTRWSRAAKSAPASVTRIAGA